MSLAAADNRRAKRPPHFSTSEFVEVEVDIDPSELEKAEWVYVGDGKDAPTSEQVIDTVMRWHDDTHDGPWRWRQHALCDQLRRREA